jgi:hypothetical protein
MPFNAFRLLHHDNKVSHNSFTLKQQHVIMDDNFATTELFPSRRPIPGGFRYVQDFLSEAEENRLLDSISKLQLHPLLFQGFEAKRKVISFGYDYSLTDGP